MIQITDLSRMNLIASSFSPKTNFWISIFGFFYFVSGKKPNCIGEPLNPAEFSKEGDVGYIRDLCVDVIARNIYNRLQLQASSLCTDLANMRTSTCYKKNACVKWKRFHCWNSGATERVTIKAEKLIEQLDTVVSKDVLVNFDDEKFLFEHIDDAKNQLIDAKAATKDSTIIAKLESLKKNCCTRFQFGQYEKEYLREIGTNNPTTMERVDELIENEDMGHVMKIFIRNFEAEHMAKITKFYLHNSISKSGRGIVIGIPHLKIEFEKGTETWFSSVYMKIPSLYSKIDAKTARDLFDREAYFYATLLPNLYQLGNCEPFSAKPYAVTDTKAFIIEDFSIQGYETGDFWKQLDMDQIQISLVLLAKYHALGYKYLETLSEDDPRISFIKSHPPVFIDKNKEVGFSIYTGLLKHSNKDKALVQRILDKENEILSAHSTLKYPDKNSMTVIIHGDYRTDNILFKKDETDKVIQAKIIDWQFCGEANPVIDMIYFFITSVPIEIFEANDDMFKNLYLNKLNEMLLSVQSTRVYSRWELDRDMLHYKYYYLRVLLTNWAAMRQAHDPGTRQTTYMSIANRWVNYLNRKGMI